MLWCFELALVVGVITGATECQKSWWGLAASLCGSVRTKFGFGIGNRNQGPILVSVSEPKFFFSETETHFFKFSHVFLLLRRIWVFKNLKLNTDLQK